MFDMESIESKKFSVALWYWLLRKTRELNAAGDGLFNNKVFADTEYDRLHVNELSIVDGVQALFDAIYTGFLIKERVAPFANFSTFYADTYKGYDDYDLEDCSRTMSFDEVWELICKNVKSDSLYVLEGSKDLLVFHNSSEAWGFANYFDALKKYMSGNEGADIHYTEVREVKYNYMHPLCRYGVDKLKDSYCFVYRN